MYTQWVESTNPIGRILAPYMTPEAARSWIKDGPMKEYSRANRGAGRYAELWDKGTWQEATAIASEGRESISIISPSCRTRSLAK